MKFFLKNKVIIYKKYYYFFTIYFFSCFCYLHVAHYWMLHLPFNNPNNPLFMEIFSQDSLYVYEFGDLDMYAVCISAFWESYID